MGSPWHRRRSVAGRPRREAPRHATAPALPAAGVQAPRVARGTVAQPMSCSSQPCAERPAADAAVRVCHAAASTVKARRQGGSTERRCRHTTGGRGEVAAKEARAAPRPGISPPVQRARRSEGEARPRKVWQRNKCPVLQTGGGECRAAGSVLPWWGGGGEGRPAQAGAGRRRCSKQEVVEAREGISAMASRATLLSAGRGSTGRVSVA